MAAGFLVLPVVSADERETVVFLVENSQAARLGTNREAGQQVLQCWMKCFPREAYNVRLILFGSRKEVVVDAEVEKYQGSSKYSDLSAGLEAAAEFLKKFPSQSPKVVLITSGHLAVDLQEWEKEIPSGTSGKEPAALTAALEARVRSEALSRCAKLRSGLFIAVVGRNPDRRLIAEMTQKANGSLAASSPVEFLARKLPLRSRFIHQYVCTTNAYPAQLEVSHLESFFKLVAAPPESGLDYLIVGSALVLLVVLCSSALRAFPGPGDCEQLEILEGETLYLTTGVENPAVLVQAATSFSPEGLQLTRVPELAVLALSFRTRVVHVLGYRQCSNYEQLDSLTKQLVLLDVRRIKEGIDRAVHGLPDDPDTFRATEWLLVSQHPDLTRVQTTLDEIEQKGAVPGGELVYLKLCLAYHPDLLPRLGPRHALYQVQLATGEETPLGENMSIAVGRHRLQIQSMKVDEIGQTVRLSLQLQYLTPVVGLTMKRLLPASIQYILRFRRSRTHALWANRET
ncbi:MAG: hypothetical protein K1Y36_24360 [Blastocatellia bacterium]|nr:hypothetical protein [Blastocatellia bacterium]